MPARGDGGGRPDRHVIWQTTINHLCPTVGRDRTVDLKMGNLRRRMDTGISPPCAVDGNRIAQHTGDRRFEISLDGALVGLTLPAVEVSAEILNHQGNSFGGGLRQFFRSHQPLGFAHQLDDRHFGIIPPTTHRANDPGVATVAIAITILRTGKQVMHQLFVIDIAQSLTTSC